MPFILQDRARLDADRKKAELKRVEDDRRAKAAEEAGRRAVVEQEKRQKEEALKKKKAEDEARKKDLEKQARVRYEFTEPPWMNILHTSLDVCCLFLTRRRNVQICMPRLLLRSKSTLIARQQP